MSRGLVMYESLKNHSKDFHFFIFAFDDVSFMILKKLDLQYCTIISLSEFETPELLSIKSGRTRAEYCWTCTPSIINHVINKYNLPSCTYLDSDLVFYSDPSVLIEEMTNNQKNVLITEHRFSPLAKFYEEKRAGRFCVQFVTFSNDTDSFKILDKWRLQCIDWCYARHENGKFGDQKYLDEWPLNYPNIHILQHQGGGIAPWNVWMYSFIKDGNTITGRTKRTGSAFKVVFFHFQYVKFCLNGSFDIGWYYIPVSIKKVFYEPYLRKLREIENNLKGQFNNYDTGFTRFKVDSLKSLMKIVFKKTFKYNLLKTN